jgi:hypothetical protein
MRDRIRAITPVRATGRTGLHFLRIEARFAQAKTPRWVTRYTRPAFRLNFEYCIGDGVDCVLTRPHFGVVLSV